MGSSHGKNGEIILKKIDRSIFIDIDGLIVLIFFRLDLGKFLSMPVVGRFIVVA